MISVDGDDVYRESTRIGYLSGTRVYDTLGAELGYYEDDRIYNPDGDKIAYLEDGYLYVDDRKIHLDYVNEGVKGAGMSELGKCALYVLVGA